MLQDLMPQAERIAAKLKARGETIGVAESSTRLVPEMLDIRHAADVGSYDQSLSLRSVGDHFLIVMKKR